MPGQQIQLSDWAQQLSGLVVLAGCAAMATPRPKPKVSVLPAVEPEKPAEPKPRKKVNLSPEVQEFMRLPTNIQRQILDYARNWIDANFERTG
jgi:hypothetical protein